MPCPLRPSKPAELPVQVPCPPKPSPGSVGPRGIGGRLRENRRGRQEGPSRTGGAGEEQRAFALPTRAEEACCASRWGPLPSETRGLGPFYSIEPKPHPPHPPRAFSSPLGPKHRPCLPPKPCPCLGPTLHSQGLFHLFFSFFLLLLFFYYCDSVLPSGCCFIYIFIFIFFLTSVSFLV